MFDRNMRLYNTISEIEYSDVYEANMELFNNGIKILKKYLNSDDDFNDEDREVLEEVYTILNRG